MARELGSVRLITLSNDQLPGEQDEALVLGEGRIVLHAFRASVRPARALPTAFAQHTQAVEDQIWGFQFANIYIT